MATNPSPQVSLVARTEALATLPVRDLQTEGRIASTRDAFFWVLLMAASLAVFCTVAPMTSIFDPAALKTIASIYGPAVSLATAAGIAWGWMLKHQLKLVEQGSKASIDERIQRDIESLKSELNSKVTLQTIKEQFLANTEIEKLRAELTTSLAGEIALKQELAKARAAELAANRTVRIAALKGLREAVRQVEVAFGKLSPDVVNGNAVKAALQAHSDLETASDAVKSAFPVVPGGYETMLASYRNTLAVIIAAAPPFSSKSKGSLSVGPYRLDEQRRVELNAHIKRMHTISAYTGLMTGYLLEPEAFQNAPRTALITRVFRDVHRQTFVI